MNETLRMLLAYKEWANELTYAAVLDLPNGEDTRHRTTRWESIAYTLSHVLVVDDIFRSHLSGRPHSYTFRNIEVRRPTVELHRRQQEMDAWYRGHLESLDEDSLRSIIQFEFVGGGQGSMSRSDMLLHVVNHGTYHRGLVSDMLCHVPAEMPTNDLPVFLRDKWRPA